MSLHERMLKWRLTKCAGNHSEAVSECAMRRKSTEAWTCMFEGMFYACSCECNSCQPLVFFFLSDLRTVMQKKNEASQHLCLQLLIAQTPGHARQINDIFLSMCRDARMRMQCMCTDWTEISFWRRSWTAKNYPQQLCPLCKQKYPSYCLYRFQQGWNIDHLSRSSRVTIGHLWFYYHFHFHYKFIIWTFWVRGFLKRLSCPPTGTRCQTPVCWTFFWYISAVSLLHEVTLLKPSQGQ